MSVLLCWAATWWVHASIALLAAALLTRTVARGDAVRDLAWRVALVLPLITATWQCAGGAVVRWDIGGFADTVAVTDTDTDTDADTVVDADTVADTDTDTDTGTGTGTDTDTGTGTDTATMADADTNLGSTPISRADAGSPDVLGARWRVALLTFVGVCALGALLRVGTAARSLKRALRERVTISDGPVVAALQRVRARMPRAPRVRLSVSPAVASPIAFGVRRPEICIPSDLADRLDGRALESVLAHELAHHVRRDPLWLPLVDAVARAVIVQPLLLLAARELRDVAEYRCDAMAAAQSGDPVVLARSLTTVASWIVERRPAPMPALSIAPRASVLQRRVMRLIDAPPAPSRRQRAVRRVAGAATVLASSVALAGFAPGWRLSDDPVVAARHAELDALTSELQELDAAIDALRAVQSGRSGDTDELIHTLQLQSQALRRHADAWAGAVAGDDSSPSPRSMSR